MGVPSVAPCYPGFPPWTGTRRVPGRSVGPPSACTSRASSWCTQLHGHSDCDATGTPVPRPRRHPRRRLERWHSREEEAVNTIDDAALVEALRQQMTKSVARQVAASGNLANVDTPNFKAVEPTFADAL